MSRHHSHSETDSGQDQYWQQALSRHLDLQVEQQCQQHHERLDSIRQLALQELNQRTPAQSAWQSFLHTLLTGWQRPLAAVSLAVMGGLLLTVGVATNDAPGGWSDVYQVEAGFQDQSPAQSALLDDDLSLYLWLLDDETLLPTQSG